MRLYSDSTVLLMQLKHSLNPDSPASIRAVTLSNIEDAKNFQSKSQIQQFHAFLRQGIQGFYGYVAGRCVHRSWVVFGPAKVFLHKFYSMDLTHDEVFIEYCETAYEARGKNIFAHALSFIGKQYSAYTVLTSVEKNNSSSIRSMKKAGFEVVDQIRIKVILGFRFIRCENKQRTV